MSTQKIITIIAAIIGVVAAFFLIRIIGVGDEAIKAGESGGTVETFIRIGYLVLFIALALVIFFTLKNVFSNPAALRSALLGVGIFLGIILVSYLVSGGDTNTYLYGGEAVSAKQSRWVGAGLISFYILSAIAIGSIFFAGILNVKNR